MTMHLYIKPGVAVFAARVNQATFSYPLNTVDYDTVMLGAYTDIRDGMTVLFGSSAAADDLGRQRVRSADATTLTIGRSSVGIHDGEVNLTDDAWITVLDEFRVWSKIPYITDDGVIYKDGDIAYSDQTDDIPPKANGGAGMAGDISGGVLTVDFPSAASYSPVGSAISTILWDVEDGTITVGTSASAAITATFPAGFRYVHLTVTDANGKTHTTHIPVYARDPAADTTIGNFQIERHTIGKDGQRLSIRILESIPESTYPDGTLIMLWEGEPADGSDRSHMRFIGWHHTDPAQIRAERTGILQDVVFECLDVAGKLDTLSGFPVSVESSSSPDSWSKMSSPNMDKYIDYLLRWHSTAFEVAPFTPSGTGANYPFVILGSDAQSLWDQAARRAQSLVPDYALTCDTKGQLAVKPDPFIQSVGDRTATVQAALTEADWSDIGYTRQRHPRVFWLRSEAVLAHATTIAAMFCIAPGESPGQGETEQPHGEQLAQSQADLNAAEGNRYARLNATETNLSITLAEGDDRSIEPAAMTWVTLLVSAATAAQRGLTFLTARGLVHQMDIRYAYGRTGMTKTITLTWEKETDGPPATTVIPPQNPPTEDWYDDWDSDPLPETDPLGGKKTLLAVNDDGYQYMTTNFLAPSAQGGPTWTRLDLGISEAIHSFVVDPFSPLYIGTGTAVNYWLATADAVYYVEDAFGSISVTLQYTFATAMTSEFQWRVIQMSFGNFNSNQAWIGVVSYYHGVGGVNGVKFVGSRDAGATWGSEVTIAAFNTAIGSYHPRPGLYLSPKSAGLAYAVAFYAASLSDGYVTTNWGATWARIASPNINPTNSLSQCLHVPWANNPAQDIVFHERFTTPLSFKTIRTAGAVDTDISPSPGGNTYSPRYGNFSLRTFDLNPDYVVMAGQSQTGGTERWGLFVSSDGGDSWQTIDGPMTVPPYPRECGFGGDTEQIIYAWGNQYLKYSTDYGATMDDRTGNIPDDYPTYGTFIGLAGGSP